MQPVTSLVKTGAALLCQAFLACISLTVYAAGLVLGCLFILYLQLPGVPAPDDPAAVANAFHIPGPGAEEFRVSKGPDGHPELLIRAFLAADNSAYLEAGGIWDNPRAWRAFLPGRPETFFYCAFDFSSGLAKRMFLAGAPRDRSYRRPFAEALMALKFSRALSRRDIVGLFIDIAYYGNGYYGVQAAARGYFGKDAADLAPAEAALLAALHMAPSRHNPYQS